MRGVSSLEFLCNIRELLDRNRYLLLVNLFSWILKTNADITFLQKAILTTFVEAVTIATRPQRNFAVLVAVAEVAIGVY